MALNDAKVEQAAAFILRARASGEPYDPIPEDCRPASVADGMRIAEYLAEQLGRRTAAWKAGFSSPKQMADLGVTVPPSGRLFEGMLHDSPAALPARAFRQPLMEAEVAFRFGADLPARAGGCTDDEILAAVGAAHIVIEAADVRFRDGLGAGLPSIIADGFAGQALIIGPEIENWRNRDLDTLPVELVVDDEVAGTAFVGDTRCRPVAVLTSMVRDLTAKGVGFDAGQVLTTGAAATPAPAQPGQRIVARFPDIGEVVVELTV